MEKEKVLETLKGLSYKYSGDAVNVVEEIVNDYEEGDDIYDLIWQGIDGMFIYYSDAFDYLKETNNYEFEDAINEGFGKNVCTIACYYLEQEVFELLQDLEIEY